MGVTPGYKQTRFGIIPDDWDVVRLSELASSRPNAIVGGPFGSDLTSRDYSQSGIPVIRGQNMSRSLVSGDFVYISPEKAKSLQANMAKPGDLVFTQRGTLGQVSVVPRNEFAQYLVSQSQMKITLDSQRVFTEYAFHYFTSDDGQRQIIESAIQTGVPHTNLSILKSYLIPLPPTKAEQEAIAGALADADDLIETLEQLLAKKRQMQLAAMQELLTGKRRLPGFTGVWETRSLGNEIDRLEAGVSVNSDADGSATGSGAAILKTSCVEVGRFLPWECKPISARDLGRATLHPRADTILISRMNTVELVGECGYVGADFPDLYVPDRLWMTRFRKHAQVSPRWLTYVLSSRVFRQQLKSIATGTSGSMKNIAKGSLLSLEIAFPPVAEQTAIATVLSDIDSEIAAIDSKLNKARLVKQGMMQQLLTGKIRLVQPQASSRTHASAKLREEAQPV